MKRPLRWLLVAVAIGASAVLILWITPLLLISEPLASDTERLTALSDARTGVIALVVGFGAMGTLIYTVRTYRLTRHGQLAERFTKSIEQLGSQDSNVRIGGIYSLERIVQEDAADGGGAAYGQTTLDVLNAYVRDRSPRSARKMTIALEQPIEAANVDVIIALKVLRKVKDSTQAAPLDLSDTNLAYADMTAMDLVGAQLGGTDLRHAKLNGADMTGADLRGALMDWRTQLHKTVVQDVRLCEGQLDPAWLSEAVGAVQQEPCK